MQIFSLHWMMQSVYYHDDCTVARISICAADVILKQITFSGQKKNGKIRAKNGCSDKRILPKGHKVSRITQ